MGLSSRRFERFFRQRHQKVGFWGKLLKFHSVYKLFDIVVIVLELILGIFEQHKVVTGEASALTGGMR